MTLHPLHLGKISTNGGNNDLWWRTKLRWKTIPPRVRPVPQGSGQVERPSGTAEAFPRGFLHMNRRADLGDLTLTVVVAIVVPAAVRVSVNMSVTPINPR